MEQSSIQEISVSRRILRMLSLAVSAALLAAIPAVAQQAEKKAAASSESKIVIRDPWIAEGPPSMKMAAGFLLAENRGAQEAAIVDAKSDAARVVELHEVVNENNTMAMRRVERFRIPAQGKLELKPGGYHLMFIQLTRVLRAGDKVAITLKFADGTERQIEAEVRRREEPAERRMEP